MKTAFTDLFVRKPVLSIVVSLLLVITGIQSYQNLTVRQYPKNENAVITITTAYIGADADLVKGFITTPIERAISAANGIDYIESTSIQGLSTIRAVLELNYDGQKALAEISTKVDQVRGDLPPESEVPILNIETADSQIAASYLSFRSDILDANEITDYLVRIVQPRLSAIDGVQRAGIEGARTYAMRIWLKPDAMAALNLNPAMVRQTLAANNYLAAIGQTKGSLVTVNLSANTNLTTEEEFKNLIIAERNDAIIRLEDIADVELGSETYETDVRYSGEPAIFIGVWVLPDANTLDVIGAVRDELEVIKESLPEGMEAGIAYDSTRYIEDSIKEVYSTLTETLLIVVVVIFLFLGSVRSVIIPVIAIPISLIGGFFLMSMLGFTINLLTLLAIVLAVGLVVDDAIVVVENVERHIREGKHPIKAALIAGRELVGPVIATTLVLVAVYTPIAFQGGLTGAYFREFALTLTGAVVVSTIVALTLSPMMSSRILKRGASERGFAAFVTKILDRLRDRYSKMLDAALRSRPFIAIFWVALGCLAIPMYQMSPKELAPMEDQGFVFGFAADVPPNQSIERAVETTKAMSEIYDATPESAFTFQITFPNASFGGMDTIPWGERDRDTQQIANDLMARAGQLPGATMFVTPPAPLPGGENMPLSFVLRSTDEPEEILSYAQQLQFATFGSDKFAFPPQIDVKLDRPQSKIVFDREKVADLGLNMQQVGLDLGTALGGGYVNRFSIDGYSYKVIPQIKRNDRLTTEQLKDIYVSGPEGSLVPLSTIATIEHTVEPRSLNRFQQLNAVKLQGIPTQTLDAALGLLEEKAAEILPEDYSIDYTGESRQLRKEGGSAAFVRTMILACIMIFLVLSAQFNSFRDPFIILLGSVPLALFGALVFTFIKMPNPSIPFWTDPVSTTLNIYAQVGIVTLVGLIAKNAILIVEFANQLQRTGLSKFEAVREASIVRLRPILMTTIATICGHFPLVLVTGAGAAARNSIGLVLVGGLSIGTIFTLFIVPVVYTFIAKEHKGEVIDEDALEDELPEPQTA